MNTTLSDVKERLAKIQESIEGVKRAEAYSPKAMPGVDLPMFVNIAGSAAFEEAGDGADVSFGVEQRTILMRLYVEPVQQGFDGEAEAASEPFLERVRDVFRSRPGLGLWGIVDEDDFDLETDGPLGGLMEARWLGDSGPVVMLYAGQKYVGVEFRLRVSLAVVNEYAGYE